MHPNTIVIAGLRRRPALGRACRKVKPAYLRVTSLLGQLGDVVGAGTCSGQG